MEAGKDIRISQSEFNKYEMARVIGSRALQLSHGAPPLITLTPEKLEELRFSPIEIAKLEFKEGVIPITVIRPLPSEIAKRNQ
jgi:DNA-directed RNA polymerase subunit K